MLGFLVVPQLGALDLGLSIFYTVLLLAVLLLTYLSFSRRKRRD
jgi:hypothetical protein